MAVRKNAKHLSSTEQEDLARAFVSMHADIVNPTAAPSDQYSRWDEFVAVHRMIQNVAAPGNVTVNFGHGGPGAYGFLPWHRYFLLLLEQRLQSYVSGVVLPYWDWTDPAGTVTVTSFLGPDGDPASNYQVLQGYFAADAPGTGSNSTPSPAWWPASLTGWRLHTAFGASSGPLRRRMQSPSALPSVVTIRSAMAKTTYPTFQVAVEAGTGTTPFHGLHNTLHGWFGPGSHMSSTVVSPFDPIFYLHHCNIDRLWAMWQMDGHASEYPIGGGNTHHHLTDPMYPWVGGASGYTSNYSFPPITMPDFSALGVVTAEDVLDHRALGYAYDTQVVIGISLDQTGSMTATTPDPMTGSGNVTKWEAATQGVAAFLQDCETAYDAAQAYVVAGVKTFRSTFTNQFTPVFAGSPYGLIKNGGAYSRAAFESTIAAQSPGGGTPLADALEDAQTTLVEPPFASMPAGERRYLAILTDGMLTSGSPLSSIPDGSFTNTAVFAMGFGTGADVDYPTIASLTAKGQALSSNQVFHGENAGVIDKFYSQAVAAALGFTPVIDPVLELFTGEHVHLELSATSAEDALFVTAQGMDFSDDWGYQLMGPDGHIAYSHGITAPHVHSATGHGPARRPVVTARMREGRLSLFLARDNADASAWVGPWTLMISWRARELDAMVMLDRGDLLVPVSAGPIRGPRWSRVLTKPERRKAQRAIPARPRHRLDVRATSTGRDGEDACSVVVNVYARTRLKVQLRPPAQAVAAGDAIAVEVGVDAQGGAVHGISGLARMIAPTRPVAAALKRAAVARAEKAERMRDSDPVFDAARVLGRAERGDPRLGTVSDEEVDVSIHGGPPHLHVEKVNVPGVYHFGVLIEGTYCPCCAEVVDSGHGHSSDGDLGPSGGHRHSVEGDHHDPLQHAHTHAHEAFERLLSVAVAVPQEEARPKPRGTKRAP